MQPGTLNVNKINGLGSVPGSHYIYRYREALENPSLSIDEDGREGWDRDGMSARPNVTTRGVTATT
jgi:hypothetical protein